jgi:antitoxin (DNA-binding transcriptional repressor) of toxin-antitoxin stability system
MMRKRSLRAAGQLICSGLSRAGLLYSWHDASRKLITVDGDEAVGLIGELLREVEVGGQRVRILRAGKVVAEIRPAKRRIDPLKQHRELLGVKFVGDPTAPLDEVDWPAELR